MILASAQTNPKRFDINANLIANLNDTDSGLLIIEKNNSNWIGRTIEYE